MPWSREEIAQRLAFDIPEGWYVNIGIGMPEAVPAFVPEGRDVIYQSENGILGMVPLETGDPVDPDTVSPGKGPVKLRPGGCLFDSAMSFSMIRGGHLDLGIIGALEVSQAGDIANWRTHDRIMGGIGGAADVCAGVRNVWVAMTHKTGDDHKLVPECRYPLTAQGVVKRVYTDLAVLEREGRHWTIRDLAPDVTGDEVLQATGFPLD